MDYDLELQLALADHRAGKISEAEQRYRKLLVVAPDHPDLLHMLGLVAHASSRLPEAIDLLRKSAKLRPTPETYTNLGLALSRVGEWKGAENAFAEAIRLAPDHAQAHEELGTALLNQGGFSAGEQSYRASIAVRPTASAYTNLGTVLLKSGRQEEATDAYRQAIQIDSAFAPAQSFLLFSLLLHPHVSARQSFSEALEWGRTQAEGQSPTFPNDRSPDRKIKVGYISPDFYIHSVASFFEPLLLHNDSAAVEIYCYSDVPRPDAMTIRLNRLAKHWRVITDLPTEKVCDRIREDRIDILVDLAGHTGNNRLPVFARQPAPVQVSYLGYPASTGLPTIKYRITDDLTDPPGLTEALHTEQLIRLPRTFLCYHPPECHASIARDFVSSRGTTFGSFSTLQKINQPLVELWSQVLLAAPDSRLLLKSASFRDEAVSRSVKERFKRLGISEERLELVDWATSLQDHLEFYNRVDIALDTFPYNGTTTICEALWMGVPVISLCGDAHVSRVGFSLLSNVALQDLVARSPAEYVQIASALSRDTKRLRELRLTLRETMRASPIMDAKQFTRNLEAAYREIWRQWCAES